MAFTIEKNIPLPVTGGGKHSEWLETLKKMEKGDSLLLKDAKSQLDIHYPPKKTGIKITARKASEGGYRIWRIA